MTVVMNVSESADFEQQYRALQQGKAFCALAGWSSISIRGKDRQAFLHNFCTNDVKRLIPGTSCEAFFTNVKGKIVGHGIVGCVDDELTFVGAPGQAGPIIEHLDRYIIREDVQLADTTDTRTYVLMVGEHENHKGAFSSSALTGRNSQIVSSESTTALSDFNRKLTERGFVSVQRLAFSAARIESAFPLFGVDFDESNLPQEVGRDREAISFTKGCYLGQETVARIDALGHVNQQLLSVRILGSEMPSVGSELSQVDVVVGRITSICFSPQLDAVLGLAMVRREANAIGARLNSAVGDCEVMARLGRTTAP
jgi:tRNA-modifying protein YgfZ